MTGNKKIILQENHQLTPRKENKPVEIYICEPGWFSDKEIYKILNAPSRTASLQFSGDDLNFVARVLYAESSGSAQVSSEVERKKEKEAILNVKHFRLNRAGYPNRVKAKTFTEVCKAPNQFESVYASSPKFSNSEKNAYRKLNNAECNDMAEAIAAVKKFISQGPNDDYIYDNFRGGKGLQGEKIGLTRFWLSSTGMEFYEAEE